MKLPTCVAGVNITRRLYIILLISVCFVHIHAQPVEYYLQLPESSGMWNIKTDFGAVGDGVTDDTKAFIEAFRGDSISYFFGENEGGYRAVYIPPGTYIVNKPLVIGDKKKVILGAGRDSVIIRLAPNSPGFNDPANPEIFIDALAKQFPAQNFFMHIKHLTIEIGAGNPGAIGLSFHTNNTGSVFDVTIRSTDPDKAGYCGLQLKSWPGPGLIKYVTIDGFDYGIKVTDDQYSMTFEYITIKNVNNTAFENIFNTCSVRKLFIENSPKGIVNKGNQSMMSLIDSEIQGSGEKAVQCTSDGLMIIRDLKTQGFDYAIISDTDTVAGPDITEWHSHRKGSAYPSRDYSLRLPVKETPEFPYPETGSSFIVLKDLNGDKDITAEFQAVIDSGYETIFIPPGCGKDGQSSESWVTSNTIYIRNNVRLIAGLGNAMLQDKPGADKPSFRIEDGISDTLMFWNFYSNYGGPWSYRFEHASKRTLVLKCGSGSYHNVTDSAILFVEDWVGDPWVITNMTAWIRDLNTETYDFIHVINDHSNIWTLGHKTEKDQTIYETKNGGKTELLGGLFYKNKEKVVHPMLVVTDADATFSYRAKGVQYLFHLEETRDDSTRNFVGTRTYDWRMALLSASAGNVPDEPANLSANGVSDSEIELCWTDNSDMEEGFIIWRSDDGTEFHIIDSLSADIVTCLDTGLMPSRTYYYQIASFASDGNSLNLFSEVAEGTTKPLGIHDVLLSEGMLLYPVPAQEKLNILVEETASGGSLVRIYDLTGSIKIELKLPLHSGHNQIDIKELQPGIYLLDLETQYRKYIGQFQVLK
jgi:hypothetical protein